MMTNCNGLSAFPQIAAEAVSLEPDGRDVSRIGAPGPKPANQPGEQPLGWRSRRAALVCWGRFFWGLFGLKVDRQNSETRATIRPWLTNGPRDFSVRDAAKPA
jgi:hypothetical protein